MAYHVFSSAFVIIVVILLRFIFGNYISQRLKYMLWLVVLVKLLVPVPLFSSSLSLQGFLNNTMQGIQTYAPSFVYEKNVGNIGESGVNDNATHTVQNTNAIQSTSIGDTILESTTSVTMQTSTQKIWSFSFIFMIVWMIGMFCCLFFVFMSNLLLKKHLLKERKKLFLKDCSLPVYVSSVMDTPCLFGVINPTIYLTEDAIKNPESLKYILTHEQVHYRQKDHIWAFFKVLCLCIYWFHPLVWCAIWLASKDSESACDEQTVKTLGEGHRRAYGEALIKISTTKSRKQDIFMCTTGITKGQNDLKERLELLVKRTRNHTFAVIMILLMVICLVGCTFSRQEKTSVENIQKQDTYVENTLLPKEETETTDNIVSVVEEKELNYKKDGLIYEEVPDWVIGDHYWANVVEDVERNKKKQKTDAKEPTKWFQSLDGKHKIKVRRWDNLICSCDKYLIYEYDGTIHVAQPDALYEPIFSFQYTTEFTKIPSGYVIAYPKDNRILYYDESFQLTKEYTGYKVGEDGGELYRDGYMAVRDIQTGLMGFMDEAGTLKIPCKYSYTEGFVNGYCPVLVDAKLEQFKEEDGSIMFDAEGGNWGIIDTKGLYVLEPSEEFENVDSTNPEEDYYCGARRFGPVQAGGIVDFIAVDQEDTVVKTVKIAFNTPVR